MVSTTNPIVHRRDEQGLDEPWRIRVNSFRQLIFPITLLS
jgi:hypothetical protein